MLMVVYPISSILYVMDCANFDDVSVHDAHRDERGIHPAGSSAL